MTSPFSGSGKTDRRGRLCLGMEVHKESGNFGWRDVPVEDIKTMLIGSTIFHMNFYKTGIAVYVETPKKELYVIYSGTEDVYVEDGCYDEWECYLEEGDDEWQDEQRKQIREANEYMEQRRRRYPND